MTSIMKNTDPFLSGSPLKAPIVSSIVTLKSSTSLSHSPCVPFISALMLLLLSHFSRVRLCATSSLGFSRQEHWSGLPFPSPMHKSKKWKWSLSVLSDSSRPHGLQPIRLLHPWGFPGKSTGVGCHCLFHHFCSTDANFHQHFCIFLFHG